jgi:hypothetical protein
MLRARETSRRRRRARRVARAPWPTRLRHARRRTVAGVAAALALAGGAAAAALVLAGGGGGAPAPLGANGLAARTTVARAALFGDRVDATLDALIDTRKIDLHSLRVFTAFAPYIADAPPHVKVEHVGPLAHVTWTFALDCLGASCLPPDPIRQGRRLMLFQPAQLTFRTPGGGTGSASVQWPDLELASRFTPYDMIWLNPFTTPPFHATTALAAPTYRIAPTLLEVLAAGLGALLLALSALLLVRAARRTALEPSFGIDPWVLAAMTPLERAVFVLERARIRGEPGERRKALERAAQELLRHGDDELGDSARALAWSYSTPTPDELADLAAEVQRTAENGRNGHGR